MVEEKLEDGRAWTKTKEFPLHDDIVSVDSFHLIAQHCCVTTTSTSTLSISADHTVSLEY